MGRRIPNVVFALKNFLSADNSKSRRCLKHTLKVVVAIYVVENKIDGSYTIHDQFGREITNYIGRIYIDIEFVVL
jgi:hypothetical protein